MQINLFYIFYDYILLIGTGNIYHDDNDEWSLLPELQRNSEK